MYFAKTVKIFLLVLLFSTLFHIKIKAADPVSFPSAPSTISLSTPSQGQIIVTNSLSITGEAPAGVLITITLQDEDYQKAFQVHETNLILNSTTTSDRNGNWVYVPPKNLVPGRYSVVAAFQNAANSSVTTDKVFFTVADDMGSTSWFTIPGGTLIVIVVAVIIFLLILIFKLTAVKKRVVFLHTNMGDIPVREIIDEHNHVEIVPLNEPVLNITPPIQVNNYPVLQPTTMLQSTLPTQQVTFAPPMNQIPIAQNTIQNIPQPTQLPSQGNNVIPQQITQPQNQSVPQSNITNSQPIQQVNPFQNSQQKPVSTINPNQNINSQIISQPRPNISFQNLNVQH